jgi:hypothetical protein
MRVILLLCVIAIASPASAAELYYKWKKGDAHAFHFESTTTIAMSVANVPGMDVAGSMMGGLMGGAGGSGQGGLNTTFRVSSDFSEKVLLVKPDGTAEVELTVHKLSVEQEGRTVDMTAKLPKSATTVKAEVDRKGRAKFFKMVTVYVEEDGGLSLAVRAKKKGPLGAEATASVDGEEVTVFASIDPKTGTVRGGAVHKKAAPAQKQLKAKEERQADQGVDALPKEIFEMMELPDGDAAEGARVEQQHPFGSANVSVGTYEHDVVPIEYSLSADVDTGKLAQAPVGEDSKDTQSKTSFLGKARFNSARGQLESLSGKMSNSTGAAGAQMKMDTQFELSHK